MILYIDTETPPIARARLAQRPVCVQWALDEGPVNVQLWADFAPMAADLFDRAERIVGANIAYDFACLLIADPALTPHIFRALDEGRVVDVQLDGKLLDIAAGEYEFRSKRGWNLQELARRAGHRIDKDEDDETGNGSWRLRFAKLDGVPIAYWPEGALTYAAGDVTATRIVYRWQRVGRHDWIAKGADPLAPQHSAHAAAGGFALHLMSCYGVLTDPATVEHISRRVEAYLERIRRRLIKAKLVRPDGSKDTKKAQALMQTAVHRQGRHREVSAPEFKGQTAWSQVERNGKTYAIVSDVVLTDGGKTGNKQVKVDRDQAILSGSRVLELYAEYASASLIRGRVERMREGCTLPLQTRFDPLKETTRTSSTQPQAPLVGEQMQNFPRSSGVSPAERKRERGFKDKAGVEHKPEFFIGLRECFVPRPGHVFVICDYPSAELHSFAEVCYRLIGWSEIGRLLNEGKDLHQHFGMSSLGRAYESYDKTVDKPHRERAKPANYGFLGGMGAEKFILYSRKGYQVRFTFDEARATRQAWRRTFPDAVEYLNWINRLKGDSETFTMVHPITGFVRGNCYYSSGANNGFQHLTALGAKAATYEVVRACYDRNGVMWGSHPWDFIHDEIVSEVPVDRAQEAAVFMAKTMADAFNRYHPNYPLTVEPVIADRWSKRAESKIVDGQISTWRMPRERLAA